MLEEGFFFCKSIVLKVTNSSVSRKNSGLLQEPKLGSVALIFCHMASCSSIMEEERNRFEEDKEYL